MGKAIIRGDKSPLQSERHEAGAVIAVPRGAHPDRPALFQASPDAAGFGQRPSGSILAYGTTPVRRESGFGQCVQDSMERS